MKYQSIVSGTFLGRPNRFIAEVDIDGVPQHVHVKNTGRCKELLTPNATVYLEKSSQPNRKTLYDLVCVKKGDKLINMDSQAPNRVVKEYLNAHGFIPGFPRGDTVQSEVTFLQSRLDFCWKVKQNPFYLEVKGVTLEENKIARFPDAPTQRGTKHLKHLIEAVKMGYQAGICFVVQMQGVSYFTTNDANDPLFAKTLREAKQAGVIVGAVDCLVTPDSLEISSEVEIRL